MSTKTKREPSSAHAFFRSLPPFPSNVIAASGEAVATKKRRSAAPARQGKARVRRAGPSARRISRNAAKKK